MGRSLQKSSWPSWPLLPSPTLPTQVRLGGTQMLCFVHKALRLGLDSWATCLEFDIPYPLVCSNSLGTSVMKA